MRSNPPDISFRSISQGGQQFEWSDSTDVGDFIRDASRSAQFTICVAPAEKADQVRKEEEEKQESSKSSSADEDDVKHPFNKEIPGETLIDVMVPTFQDRTRFLRRKLEVVTSSLKNMDTLKSACDREAHRGARRMAIGGLGMLVVYWAAVARLTFWDYGWYVSLWTCCEFS
jgi:hypothetical protein